MKKDAKKFIDEDMILNALKKRAEGFFYNEEILEYCEKEEKKSIKETEKEINSENKQQADEANSKAKKSKNNVSKINKSSDECVYSDAKSGEEQQIENENQQKLILVKKKVTTHYIPPDMSAIKMLLENFGEKMKSGTLDELSDDELISMRDNILQNLKEKR